MRRKVLTKRQRAHLRFKQKQPVGISQTRRQRQAVEAIIESGRVQIVREFCVARDGYCRCGKDRGTYGDCQGPSEWAHYGEKKRFKTRNQDPEVRHTTKDSLMLCRKHHNRYDRGRMGIVQEDPFRGCNGPLTYPEAA